MSAVAAGETAGAPALGPASDPTPTPAGSRRGATRGGAGWAWLRERGIKSTIPERADQIANRRKRPGRPIDFGDEQKERYKGRNVVERCFSFIKQWRGLASRYDKTACSYAAGLCLSAALQWI